MQLCPCSATLRPQAAAWAHLTSGDSPRHPPPAAQAGGSGPLGNPTLTSDTSQAAGPGGTASHPHGQLALLLQEGVGGLAPRESGQLKGECSRWGSKTSGGCRAAGQLCSPLMGPSADSFSSWTTAGFLGSGREEQLATLFIQIPFWQYSECFSLSPAGSESVRGATGCTCLHTAFHGGIFTERRNSLLKRPSPYSGPPTPGPPTPAHGHVSRNTEDEKHAIFKCVSFTVTHFFSLCILADPHFKIPSDCSDRKSVV